MTLIRGVVLAALTGQAPLREHAAAFFFAWLAMTIAARVAPV